MSRGANLSQDLENFLKKPPTTNNKQTNNPPTVLNLRTFNVNTQLNRTEIHTAMKN